MMRKQNRNSWIAKGMLLLFTLGCTAGAAGLAGSGRQPAAAYPTQAVVEISRMQATNTDAGMQQLTGKAVVTATYLNVRSGPGVSYAISGTLKNKDLVSVLGKFSNNWYKIQYGTSRIGYVNGIYLEVTQSSTQDTTAAPSGTDKGMVALTGKATTTEALNVRTGPSTGYTKIGVLPQGNTVTLVGKFATNWYKIQYGGGYAYVCGDYLKVSASPEPPTTNGPAGGTDQGMTAFNGTAVTTGNLNVRKGPSTAYGILGVLANGVKVTTVGKFSTGWYKIKYGNGYAYVSGAYLGKITPDGGNTDTDRGMTAYQAKGSVTELLNVRSGPSTAYDKLGQLPENTKVTIVGKFASGWYKIEYKSGYAYVSGAYIRLDSSTTTTTKPDTDAGMTAYTAAGKTTENLNVRSGPATSYPKIGVLPYGTTVNIVGKFTSGWYKIKYGSGYAYVSGVYVRLSGSGELPANPLDDIFWIPNRKPMPSSYVPSGLVNLKSTYGLATSGTQYLVGEAAAAYYELYKGAKAAGVLSGGDMVANSAYRSYSAQQALYNSIANKQQVSKPGHSEHQLGVAVDIAQQNYSTFKNSPLCAWLKTNAYKYGFILRYTADKTEITGIIDEPWHYRYVGKKNAEAIYRSGKCLEEYVDTL